MKSTGLIIKELRESKKISQAELAQVLEVQPTTISNYENDVSKPNLSKLNIISNYFGVPLNDLVEASERKNTIPNECPECRSKDKIIEILEARIKDKDQMIELLMQCQESTKKQAV